MPPPGHRHNNSNNSFTKNIKLKRINKMYIFTYQIDTHILTVFNRSFKFKNRPIYNT